MKLTRRIREKGLYALVFIAIVTFLLGASWLVTCGIIKLITLCFGLSFKWSVASGIWLVMVLLKAIFKRNTSN